ncbi:MAG: cytochrome c [Acidimicrobiaceae bacterium]|nr:cytochrome c [Acidimicrobiaceae bacterium]
MTTKVFLALASAIMMITACAADDVTSSDDDPSLQDRADGIAVYQAHCASCHGSDLRGTDRGPSLFSIVYEPGHHSDTAFRLAIRNGTRQHHWRFGDMPPVDNITDNEIEAVIAYIRNEQNRFGFER